MIDPGILSNADASIGLFKKCKLVETRVGYSEAQTYFYAQRFK